ncbi:hypothetical protein ACFVT5_10050 [Streptomyces sp. NPDC058001]|uniref:hypothetical protein n=1 Tax=Streptomyces sp. NPDC058001 TaxID=3346300 RepID=UPI0036E93E72
MGMKSKLALGAVVGITIIGAVSCSAADDSAKDDKSSSVTSGSDGQAKDKKDDKKAEDAADKGEKKGSQADQFKDFVNKNGTAKEKEAAGHITKIQGAEEQNDILDSVDIYTDYTGGIMGKGQAPSQLIASSFADWKTSKNGLVTVYDADGEMLGNGNF